MKKKTKAFKLILLLVVVGIMVGATIYLIPVIKQLGTSERTSSISRKN